VGVFVPQAVKAIQYSDVTFSTQSVSGSNGISYVYFQAQQSNGSVSAVPTHRYLRCPTPYYMKWVDVVQHPDSTSYNVQIFGCYNGEQYNDGISRAGQLFWRPGNHPVLAGLGNQLANGQLIYALNVALDPAAVKPNQDTSVVASIADDFVEQADRTLNISVDPNGWAVTSWTVDFGDGQKATVPGGGRAIAPTHRYATPGSPKPVVSAHVAGTAQVADFDPATGDIVLLNEPFTVDVTNSTLGQVAAQPVVAYTPPVVRAGVMSRLQPGAPPLPSRGADAIEAPRGTPVYLYIRPIVDAEGTMTLDGKPSGTGRSVLLNWRLGSGSPDGPPAQVTPAGATGPPDAAVVQQWNSPDRIGPHGAEPYAVTLDYTIRTTYPDGQTRDYPFSGSVRVTVGYAANSG
jgi:hypothetical protein